MKEKIIKKYECEYCNKTFDKESDCLRHEEDCIHNTEIWELGSFKCNSKTGYFDGTDKRICSNSFCLCMEHCNGTMSFYINKLTGEIKDVF